MISIVRWILLPISLIYWAIVRFRNILYDKQILKSTAFDIPTIVIGNLAIGGTGKSPMTEYIVRLLESKHKIATLSRGYGRKTKGFRLVETSAMATEVGDEPLQFKNKFPHITVAVSEDRCLGIEQLKAEHDLIILDDAYQHRKLKPGYSILLFDFNSLFKPIITLPTGDFRDNLSASKRADCIVITKCPKTIYDDQKKHIERLIRKHNVTSPIFYTSIYYDKPINNIKEELPAELEGYDVLLFCGIANPDPLVSYLQEKENNVSLVKFPDHYNYERNDFDRIIHSFEAISSDKKIILTTEKDMQRIPADYFKDYPLYYIPIHLKTADYQRKTFDNFIETYVSTHL